MAFTFAALLLVETDDPRLTEEAIVEAIQSAGGVARMRRAVLQHLPKDVTRLVAVLPVEHAEALMLLHEAFGDQLGVQVAARPPADYVPPTRG